MLNMNYNLIKLFYSAGSARRFSGPQVLLAEGGIVKVADFGLARQMKNYQYKKNEDVIINSIINQIKW